MGEGGITGLRSLGVAFCVCFSVSRGVVLSRPISLLLISLELTNCQWVAMCAYFFFLLSVGHLRPSWGSRLGKVEGGR